jgi:hypothetical protein
MTEQYTDESRAALTTATEHLIEKLRAHTTYLLALRGGSSELLELFDHQEAIGDVVRTWNDAVWDHTGTLALSLSDSEDDPDDWDDADEDDADLDAETVSVVSRFDLRIADADAVLAAGREAHRRLWPKENEEDAVAAVSRIADALYSINHEAGEPWFDIPGAQPVSGARVFIAVDPEYDPPDPGEMEDDVSAPLGAVVYTEGWRFG